MCLIIYVQIANIAKHKSIVLWFVLNTCVLYREVFKKLYRLFWFHHKTNLLCEQIWTEPTFSVPRNREATQTWKKKNYLQIFYLNFFQILHFWGSKDAQLPTFQVSEDWERGLRITDGNSRGNYCTCSTVVYRLLVYIVTCKYSSAVVHYAGFYHFSHFKPRTLKQTGTKMGPHLTIHTHC